MVPAILYEDNHLVAVNKRCGDITQGDKTGDTPLGDSVKSFIKEKYNKPGNVFLGLIHRLDRPTSGIILFARTSKALARMNDMFKMEGLVQKTYWAVVDNKPDAETATLEHWLVRDEKQNKSFASLTGKPGAKHCSLTYRYKASSDRFHLLEIQLHTGRQHQIRAQLAAINLHIKGDLKYGFPRSNPDAGIHLHSRKICFTHPVTKAMITLTANPPSDPVWDYFVSTVKD